MAEAYLIAGLGYGDEGKGTTIDWLCDQLPVKLIVRYNGGAQAAHNVVWPNGVHHTFSQFGSTFLRIPTFLSRFMLVNPITLMSEAKHLAELGRKNPLDTVYIDRLALVTTPFHMAANRLHELSRLMPHGSCGMGIGETVDHSLRFPEEAIRVGDFADTKKLLEKLKALQRRKQKETEIISVAMPVTEQSKRQNSMLYSDSLADSLVESFTAFASQTNIVSSSFLEGVLKGDGVVLFEGAQGVLLDEDYGFHPHTTWSHCTFQNAEELLKEAGHNESVKRLGITRAFATRHGAGPFVTEDDELRDLVKDDHNTTGAFQGSFRVGTLDIVALRYALDVLGPVDGIVMTCLDRLDQFDGAVPVCTGYIAGETAAPYCEVSESGLIERIRVQRPVDLRYQEGLGRLLSRVMPVHENILIRENARYSGLRYALQVADQLGVRLSIVSIGPSDSDKYWVAQSRRPL